MKVGSLFAGIGGFDIAAEYLGWRTSWFVEWDPHCQFWLAEHFPGRPIYGDITGVDFTQLERVDVLCGGFPCQPSSAAGRRRGKLDDRWLWPDFARAIRELRPRYVVVENVPGLLSTRDERGCSLAGAVLGDLAALGYDAEWAMLSAADVGSPQERERVWIVAYAKGEPGRLAAGRSQPGAGADDERRGESVGHAERGDGERPRESGNVAPATGGNEEEALQRERGRHTAGDTGAGMGDAESGRREAGRTGHAETGRGRPEGLDALGRDANVGDASSGRRRTWAELAIRGPERRCARVGDTERAERRAHDAAGNERDRRDAGWGEAPGAARTSSEIVGEPESERSQGNGRPVEHAGEFLLGSTSVQLRPWDEWVAVAGADGTLRRIPREAADAGPQSAVRADADGISRELAGHEPAKETDVWPVADGKPGRVARLKAVGNAVVWQCALDSFRRIEEIERERERNALPFPA